MGLMWPDLREYLDALDMTTRVIACDKAFGCPRS
jgi:hypothetical protein